MGGAVCVLVCVGERAVCVFGFLCVGACVCGGEKVEVGMGIGLGMCGV